MALTFTTGMTLINNADAVTNWAAYRISGSGGAPSAGTSTDVFKEGTASNSTKITGASWDGGLIYDYYTANGNTVLNLSTTGNEVLAVWVMCTTPGIIQTLANNGIYILVQSSAETTTTAPTKYAKWTVSGSNVYPGGWVLFLIDTRKTPTTTAGGWVVGTDLAITRRIAVGLNIVASPGTIRADNLYVDACWYGRPQYTVKGDGSLIAAWADFLSNSDTNKNGLIQDLGGAYQIACGIRFGSSTQTATTTFSDSTGKPIILRRPTYYQGGAVQDALTYSDYYIIDALGASSFKTSITFGSVVGTGENRQGVLGGSIISPDTTNMTFKVDFQTGVANLSAVNLYGVSFIGAKAGVLFDNDSGSTLANIISCYFINCGEVDPGSTGNGATILNCTLINPLGGTSANRGIIIKDTANNVKKLSCITSGNPSTQHLTRIPASGSVEVPYYGIIFYGDYSSSTLWHGEASANSAAITINASNSANPDAAEFDKTGSPPATVSVSNPKTLTLTGLVSGSDIVILTAGTTTERVNVDANAGTTYAFNYTYQDNDYVDICVYKAGYKPFATRSYLLSNSNSSLPIAQVSDKDYVP